MNKSTLMNRRSNASIFLVILFLFVGMGRLSAQISFTAKEPTVGQIITSVKSQSSYQFFHDSKLSATKVNAVDVKNVSLDSLLSVALRGRGIDYKIEDKICYLSAVKANDKGQKESRVITGRVADSKTKAPLVGVAVTIIGTSAGVTTDLDGKYSITVPGSEAQVNFSYIGYDPQVITVGTRTVMDVAMTEGALFVDEVVVTAMGIKRETKALTYNVQTIGADKISTVKDANVMNSLAGKIAGVTINQSASGVGGSTRVVMRGVKSLFGQNNALYVLDGIPLSDLRSAQSSNFYEGGGQGDSEGVSNINPDDIESMSVLTGAAATALYGNRGANGVVLITTKKGSDTKTKVSYSNNTSFATPFVTPQFQNTYGQEGEGYSSWGTKLDSPSSYNPLDFFQTSATTMNTLGVTTGNEGFNMHASVGSVHSRGLVPNSKYERYNVTLRSSSVLVKDKLTFDMGINYMEQDDRNPSSSSLYYNPIVPVYLFPPGDDFNRFIPYETYNAERGFPVQNWSYGSESLEGLKQNPFWIANRNVFENSRSRVILSGELKYKITDWINVSGRARLDKADNTYERKLYASTDELFAKSATGNYSRSTQNNKNMYGDVLVNINKRFGDDWMLVANLGASFNDEQWRLESWDGPLGNAVNFFHKNNVSRYENDIEQNYRKRTTALYATAQVGYKSMVYLDLTARKDYFSSLYGTDNCGIVYPSVGLSGIITEMVNLNKNIVSFWKVRASYSEVGNDPEPYLTDSYVSMENGAISSSAFYPMTNLKPELTKAFEVGTDVRLFKDKLNIAFTYYNTNTFNQLFRYNLPPSTGYAYAYYNAGKVNNWGIELTAGLRQNLGPVKWNSTVTYSLNRNRIKELMPEFVPDPISGDMIKAPSEFEVSNAGTYRMMLKNGGTMGDIYVTSFKRDPNGFIYVNPGTGRFEIDQSNFFKIGEASPKYNIGFNNTFDWNGIALGFLIDARVGGVVVSSTQALLDQYGVSQATADARDNGGVDLNFGKVDAKTYYETISAGKNGAALSEYTYSATNVRLRELTLSYNLPKKWFGDKLDMTVSFIGRNLWMMYCKAPFDPDLTSNTGTYMQGYDYFMLPSQRSLGFGVKVQF